VTAVDENGTDISFLITADTISAVLLSPNQCRNRDAPLSITKPQKGCQFLPS